MLFDFLQVWSVWPQPWKLPDVWCRWWRFDCSQKAVNVSCNVPFCFNIFCPFFCWLFCRICLVAGNDSVLPDGGIRPCGDALLSFYCALNNMRALNDEASCGVSHVPLETLQDTATPSLAAHTYRLAGPCVRSYALFNTELGCSLTLYMRVSFSARVNCKHTYAL